MRLIDKVKKHPEQFEIYKLMDILEKTKQSHQVHFGQGNHTTEPANIKGVVQLHSQPCDVGKITFSGHNITLHNNLISLTNSNNLLDSAIVEQFFIHNYESKPMVDFLDIFNHKLVTLFYQAHKNLQSYSSSKALQQLIQALANTNKLKQHSCKHLNFAWPSFYNLNSIKNYLTYILDNTQVTVQQKAGEWLGAKHLQFTLGKDSLPDYKKTGRILGASILQSKFGLHCRVHCKNLEQYKSLLPGQEFATLLMRSIQFHLPIPESISLELICTSDVYQSQGLLGQTSTTYNQHSQLHSLYTYNINDTIFTSTDSLEQ